MQASVILFVAIYLLLVNLSQAADSELEGFKKNEIKRERFRGFKRKRQLLGGILSPQGGDLISLFSPRLDIGTSYGQTNNDLQFNSNNDNRVSREKEPESPFGDFLSGIFGNP